MATRKLETVVSVSGEQQYKAALRQCSTELGTLKSEMKKTTAQFQDNAGSMEALKAKGEVLNKTLAAQKEKVEVLKKALAESTEKFGEADSRTQRWAQRLNEAEAAVYDTESAIKKNNAAMDGGSTAGGKLGGILDTLKTKFGAELPSGVSTALESIGGFSAGTIAALGAAVVAVETLKKAYEALIETTTEAAANADDILTESLKTGISTEEIQKLKYASQLIDVSYETISGSLTKLKNNMASAQNGSASLQETFQKLGVSYEDSFGNLRNGEEVFYELIDALGKVENATERDTLTMALFGKSGEDLNPLIIQGSEALRAYGEEAEAMGYVLNDSVLQNLGAVDDAYQRLQNTQESVKSHLADEFSPTMTEVYTDWATFISKVGKAVDESGIVNDLGVILTSLMDILEPIGELTTELLPALKVVLDPIAGTFAWIADTIQVILGILTLNGDKIMTALGFNASVGQYSNLQRWQGYGSSSNAEGWVYDSATGQYKSNYNAAGDLNYRGGATWVGENGPERVYLPQGTAIQNAQASRLSGGDTYNISLSATSVQEFNDIIEMARAQAVLSRMGAKA